MPYRPHQTLRTYTAWPLLWLAAVLAGMTGCTAPPPPIAELHGQTMGTRFSIKLSPPPSDDRLITLRRAIEHRLAEINQQLSTYTPDSDLMRFNRSRSTDWQSVPAALAMLVDQAKSISRHTEGHYDVTVGPLVELWGFGASGPRTTPPSAAAIKAALAEVGDQRLDVRLTPPSLRKHVPALAIDLSSIAKGWAVDQISDLLLAHGIDAFLVEIGGETRARGVKHTGQPWRIAIERPLYGTRDIQGGIEATDIAIATSGDYRNYFEHDGQRYSHTIDPTSGEVVHHRLASVTILADTCAEADAWATALLALGERRAPELAERLGLRALFIVREPGGLREQASGALARAQRWRSLQ